MIRAPRYFWLAAVAALLLLGIFRGTELYRSQKVRGFPLELEPGNNTGHRLGAGERHEHRFSLAAGDYLELAVEQLETDVSVSLFDPDDEELLLADSWIGARGPEVVAVVAEKPGTYRLLIRAAEERTGRYEVHVHERHPATAGDRDRAAAAAKFSQAEKLRRRGDPDSLASALEHYRTAADLWKGSGELFRQAVAYAHIGRTYDLLGNPQKASDGYRRALDLFPVSQPHPQIGQQKVLILMLLGRQQRRLGALHQARDFHQQAQNLARQLGEKRREAESLNNIAVVSRTLGDTNRAVDNYEQALALLETLDEPSAVAKTLCNVAQLYMTLGDLERAEKRLRKALLLSKASESRAAEARALRGFGDLERRQGRLQDSLKSLRRALALDRTLKNRSGQATTLRNLGRTYYELYESGSLEEPYGEASIDTYEEALEIYRELDDPLNVAIALNELGRVIHELREDPQRALTYHEQALALFRQVKERAGNQDAMLAGEATAQYAAARAEQRLGRLAAARSRIEVAMRLVESLRSQTDVASFRTSFFATKQDYYELAIALLVDLGEPAKALEISERRRARTLQDVLTQTLITDVEDGSLGSEIDLAPSAGPGVLVDPNGFDDPPDLDLQRIQELLDDETILLEYSLGEERSFLWLVAPTEFELHELPAEGRIDSLARDAHRLLSKSHGRRGDQRELVTEELSSLLLRPVADRLGSKRLLIVTEEALQYVPFGALPIPDSETADPMVTEHEIVYLPSLSILALLRRPTREHTPADLELAVVADPVFSAADSRVAVSYGNSDREIPPRLPYTREEAQNLLDLAPDGRTLALLGFDASREKVIGGELAKYRYVHFATHGWFDRERPELSGLVLSGIDHEGRPVDGFLSIPDIYRLELPVEMVALSACRTGLGEEIRGEGLVGLTQSFFNAGAARVIVSYWEVDDDATAELMFRVYRGIFKEDLAPAAALRKAQVSMLEEPRWKAPYYWAAFFLQGEWH